MSTSLALNARPALPEAETPPSPFTPAEERRLWAAVRVPGALRYDPADDTLICLELLDRDGDIVRPSERLQELVRNLRLQADASGHTIDDFRSLIRDLGPMNFPPYPASRTGGVP